MSPKTALTLGAELRRRGLTYEQAAVLGGVRESTISRIVAGKVRARPQTIVSLSRALGISAARMQSMCGQAYLTQHPEEDPDADEAA